MDVGFRCASCSFLEVSLILTILVLLDSSDYNVYVVAKAIGPDHGYRLF